MASLTRAERTETSIQRLPLLSSDRSNIGLQSQLGVVIGAEAEMRRSGSGATGFDFVNLLDGTTDFDPVTFALDGAALVPTLGAVGADLRIANLDEELVSARMAGDPATFSAVRAQIMATGTVRIVLGSKAFAVGAGAAAYSAGAFTAQQIAGAGGG